MRTAPNEHLAGQTSPYVLQHADNPVDWYPWGPEAFDRARLQDKPIFLSVGYAACHWCHVMAHESFEDATTAAVLNEGFVSIKVDREERPDVDAIYMDAVQAMTGSGGWPMSVFLTPDGEPFYAGTYFPDRPRHGMPSFRQVLDAIAETWAERRADAAAQGARVTEAIGRPIGGGRDDELDPARIPAVTAGALGTLTRAFDERWGGFGGAPKFPQASVLRWLLDRAARGDADARAMLTRTLDAMADGGIHDHVGGGFARYSTDAAWHVPHFEKMLYDNAQLLGLYARAAVVTASDRYRRVALGIADWMLREMQQPDGGLSSSQDADSDGVEGAFFVWSWAELTSIVNEPVADALGATPEGNWEGTNVLWLPRPVGKVAAARGLDEAEFTVQVDRALAALFEHRATRIPPATDDKVITAWNGLAIGSLAVAGSALGAASLLEAAERCATFIWENLRDPEDRLLRSWRAGSARVPGFADDHAALGLGLCALYERTGRSAWLQRAIALGDALIDVFASDEGGFHQVGSDAEPLVVRKLDLLDEPTPSGNAGASELLIRLSHYTGDARYERYAERALRRVLPVLERAPTAAGSSLAALELLAGPTVEVAIVGDPSADSTRSLLDAVVGADRYLPNAIVGLADPSDERARDIPLFEGRLTATEAVAYVCERFVCQLPVSTATALRDDLDRALASDPGMSPAT